MSRKQTHLVVYKIQSVYHNPKRTVGVCERTPQPLVNKYLLTILVKNEGPATYILVIALFFLKFLALEISV